MTITVIAKTRARSVAVKKFSDTEFEVSVTAPPADGRANKAIIAALAAYFHVAPSRIELVSGHNGKRKILRIIC